jgi:hypothetical protein
MIWTLDSVYDLCTVFADAGPINEQVVSRSIQTTQRKQQAPSHPNVPRWYYLYEEEPRISLCCVGSPLQSWQGASMLIVGAREIIGEFAGNRHVVGRKGLQMKMQPIDWLHSTSEKHFATGAEFLAAISEQVLDQADITRVQQHIARKYRWE